MTTPGPLLQMVRRIAEEALVIARHAATQASVGMNAFVQGGNAFGALAVLGTKDNHSLEVITNNTSRALFDTSGNFTPPADNSGQVGTNALRWALIRGVTVTSGDHHLVDEEGKSHWVMREAPDGVLLYDNRADKLYRIPLEPIPTPKGFRVPRKDIHHSSDVQRLLATIDKMTSAESRGDLATVLATSIGAAEAGPSAVARDAQDHLEQILRQIQETLAQHQDMSLGDHEELRSVHDEVARALDTVSRHAERHDATEAAAPLPSPEGDAQ
jgi:hypothetical protein